MSRVVSVVHRSKLVPSSQLFSRSSFFRDSLSSRPPSTMSTMSGARLSPTANLLRRSRLFALPQALQPPPQPATSNRIADSNTATLPFPIRASIETQPSSLARGDWGLKRPLPAKSTTRSSSSPIVRVNNVDTFEHITDFESAADHTFTLQKFQELSLPISLPRKRDSASTSFGHGRHESVFESTHDNTHQTIGLDQNPNARRYRFKGPWLAGQTDAEFEDYMQKLRSQKPELMHKLKDHLQAKKVAQRRRYAMDAGEDLKKAMEDVEIDEEEFKDYLRALRSNPGTLGPIMFELLDLAPPPRIPSDRLGRRDFEASASNVSSVAYADEGPPKTHPSAGLSYLRTLSHMDNHPVFGPQEHHRPVQARILRSKRPSRGNRLNALAGVGGIVTEDINPHAFKEDNAPEGITHFNPDIPGGAKYWVRTVRTSIDSSGKIMLATDRASDSLKAAHGAVDYKKPLPEVVQGVNRTVAPLDSNFALKRTPKHKNLGETQNVANYLKAQLLSKKSSKTTA
jgi:hypothetical protein